MSERMTALEASLKGKIVPGDEVLIRVKVRHLPTRHLPLYVDIPGFSAYYPEGVPIDAEKIEVEL